MRRVLFAASASYLLFGGAVAAVDQRIGATTVAFLVASLAVGMVLQLPALTSALAFALGLAAAVVGVGSVPLDRAVWTSF